MTAVMAVMAMASHQNGDINGVVNGDGMAQTLVIIIVAMCDTEQRIIVVAVLVEMALVP